MIRRRLTVSSSLLRRFSSRAAMSCSCVLSSKSCASALRSSGDFCVAPCLKIFCLSTLIVSIRLNSRSRCLVSRISSLRSDCRSSWLSVFLRENSLSMRAMRRFHLTGGVGDQHAPEHEGPEQHQDQRAQGAPDDRVRQYVGEARPELLL